MESTAALDALSALSQETRLAVFRLLVRREPDGVAAGDLAKAVGVPANTMSVHLGVLSRAGLVTSERHSRSIVYRADLARFRALMLFMLMDCCDGRSDICAPLIADLTPCCPSKETVDV
ncbi:ArsR family transcriptional regulator [Rhodopseudomonas thermotolerans]|jgi:DNA-binding transcriptional ArsR family regulator|uniref:ArsR family transcriptional regulator n=2 Tax=Rhodopseudomonas TaxID=1073 RepID=A0A336JS60_9BRAD|nr:MULTISPECIES: metalloregulator ArsR/SmtB family transcription factor [Rhodopseudomonas]RED28527.1 ArsR family transcriptional regulator [Rhodopseudomonas pentothenatexigens]REF91446.1 ArsR family transcriptional regulator [Rhodopseudomonas thermotolerans]SSW92627.1 ArsR family transcriptional regulator [Rhodopseudomonas pentothenatexigens]